jgi:hypothetical protein
MAETVTHPGPARVETVDQLGDGRRLDVEAFRSTRKERPERDGSWTVAIAARRTCGLGGG